MMTTQIPEQESATARADLARLGFRRLARSVAVITARAEGRRYAMAATAVSELSLTPPSILVCVNAAASIHAVLAEGADFCVNLLAGTQEDVALACSRSSQGEARFAAGVWRNSAVAAPRLEGAQAAFACRNVSRFYHCTHSICIGEIEEVYLGEVDPLIFVDGAFARLAPTA